MNRHEEASDRPADGSHDENPYRAGLASVETSGGYRTVPEDTAGMPSGVPYIIGNEAAERFSYYGMRSILVIYMTQYLVDRGGNSAYMTEAQARAWYSVFEAGVYAFPVLGALLADGLLGKYRTILWVSLIYCLGHLALAVDDTRVGLAVGLTLIAIGSGGIKPCVSANVGDQFGPRNKHLLEKVYGWFYFSINVGAAISTFMIPLLRKNFGPQVAFAVPGVLMLLATIIFWMGRRRFVHVPPAGLDFLRELRDPESLRFLLRLGVVYLLVGMFWSLYNQSGSAWVLQTVKMNRNTFGYTWEPDQIHFVNPILILLYIPLFTYVVYPALNRVYRLTALRKMGIGFVLTAAAFAISAWIEHMIADGLKPHVYWQILAYLILTAGEVMVSITGLEFSYSQAPASMKSVVMAMWLLAVAAGSIFTAIVNFVIQNEDKSTKLPGPSYYWFFTITMLVTAVIFVFVATRFHGHPRVEAANSAE